jgi:glyoxylase-like metal-dependent hydrolase (beta-lactamase superfamily II)
MLIRHLLSRQVTTRTRQSGSRAGDRYERADLRALAQIIGDAQTSIRVREMFLTHGHDDHTGSAAALAQITGRGAPAWSVQR